MISFKKKEKLKEIINKSLILLRDMFKNRIVMITNSKFLLCKRTYLKIWKTTTFLN